MGQVPLVKSTPWADPGAWNTPPRVPPEGAVTGETAPRPRRPAQPFLPGPLTCRGPGRPRWAGALSASRRECAERDLRLTPPPRTPRSSLKSNVTAKPSFSKGGWILLAQSLLAGRDFIFRVDLLMALSSLKKTRGGEPPLPRPPPSPEQAHRSLGRAWPSACRAPRAASASSAPPAAGRPRGPRQPVLRSWRRPLGPQPSWEAFMCRWRRVQGTVGVRAGRCGARRRTGDGGPPHAPRGSAEASHCEGPCVRLPS